MGTLCQKGLRRLQHCCDHVKSLAMPSSSSETRTVTESTETMARDAKAVSDEAIQSSTSLLSALQEVPCKWQLSTKTPQFRTLCSTVYDQTAEVTSMCKEAEQLWTEKEEELRMVYDGQVISEELKVVSMKS